MQTFAWILFIGAINLQGVPRAGSAGPFETPEDCSLQKRQELVEREGKVLSIVATCEPLAVPEGVTLEYLKPHLRPDPQPADKPGLDQQRGLRKNEV